MQLFQVPTTQPLQDRNQESKQNAGSKKEDKKYLHSISHLENKQIKEKSEKFRRQSQALFNRGMQQLGNLDLQKRATKNYESSLKKE